MSRSDIPQGRQNGQFRGRGWLRWPWSGAEARFRTRPCIERNERSHQPRAVPRQVLADIVFKPHKSDSEPDFRGGSETGPRRGFRRRDCVRQRAECREAGGELRSAAAQSTFELPRSWAPAFSIAGREMPPYVKDRPATVPESTNPFVFRSSTISPCPPRRCRYSVRRHGVLKSQNTVSRHIAGTFACCASRNECSHLPVSLQNMQHGGRPMAPPLPALRPRTLPLELIHYIIQDAWLSLVDD